MSLTQHKRPNLVFVYPDQMRGQALGFLHEDPVLTPRLDQFAAESLVLTQAASNYPVCSPARAMLMTGKYPHANHVLGNCNSEGAPFGYELQQDDLCWSDILKAQGYATAYIGKWHLDSPYRPYVPCYNNTEEYAWNEWTPPARRHGFDFWYAYGTYDLHMQPMYWPAAAGRDEFIHVQEWGPIHETDLAVEYIRNEGEQYRRPDQPFALVVAMNPPHMPYDQLPQRYVELYQGKSAEELLVRPNVDLRGVSDMSRLARQHTKNYFAMISGVDEQFGRILEALKSMRLEQDTIVVFTSDHGNCLGTHEMISKNNPYEESMRVPFLIRWPGKIPARQDDLLLSTPDIYPTLLHLMGLADDIPPAVQGESYATLFQTGQGRRPGSQLYLYTPVGQPALGMRGVRSRSHKLVVHKAQGQALEFTLYDLQRDPYELNNLAQEQPAAAQRLLAEELIPWLQKTNDPWLANLDQSSGQA